MSGASGSPAQRRGNFASRKARGEEGGMAAGAGGNKNTKAHGYDARLYHQNANTRGIQALRTFDCPVCDSKNTIRVDLHARLGKSTVRCTYCMSLRPVPADLPYPYTASFIPSLENKADVFFKFNEMYNALLQGQMASGNEAGEAAQVGASGGHSATETDTRKRSREDEDVEGGLGGVSDGLLGGLTFYPTEEDALGSVELDGFASAALEDQNVDTHGVFDDEAMDAREGSALVEDADRASEPVTPPVDDADQFAGDRVEDVDIEAFFSDDF